MDPLQTVAEAIEKRPRCEKELAAVERQFEAIEWWDLPGRFLLPGEIRDRRRELQDLNAAVNDEKILRLAQFFAEELWKQAAGEVVQEKNLFGPAAHGNFDKILDQAMRERPNFNQWFSTRRFWLKDLPEVDKMVDREFVDENTQRIMRELFAVAASKSFLIQETHAEKEFRVVIQHVASGLRAQFIMDGSGFGEVMSKSEHIISLDPKNPGTADTERYAGLGIGRRLYRLAQAKYPAIRWRKGHLSGYADPLRRRLHASDPFHWEGPCYWCEQVLPALDGRGWKDKGFSAFADHP